MSRNQLEKLPGDQLTQNPIDSVAKTYEPLEQPKSPESSNKVTARNMQKFSKS